MSDVNGVRKAGRPSDNTHARELLLYHARELFVRSSYNKVSTRMIAERAGVNMAMIRYYFGNKEGLFESMLRETIAPMSEKIASLSVHGDQQHLFALMRTYYQEMFKQPLFPHLILQVMNMNEQDSERKLLEKIFQDVLHPAQNIMFEKLMEAGVLKTGMNPQLCRLSFMSLTIFPFIIPKGVLFLHGIKIDEEFLNQLIEHNIQLMMNGFVNPPLNQGSVNEN